MEAVDSLDLEGVTVCIIASDSIEVACAKTDGFGIATLRDIEGGEYLMRFTRDDLLPISARLNLRQNVDLGELPMDYKSTITLDEFVVEGSRITKNAERMTITPYKETIRGSINSFEVLRRLNLPGLYVNPMAQSISIYNKMPVIKVNGVPQSLSYLNSIDPEMIAKIEYTDMPSARYLQDGVGGEINIILKKLTRGGYIRGELYAGGVAPNVSGWLSGSINYKDSEFGVMFNGAWSSNRSIPFKNERYTSYLTDGIPTITQHIASDMSTVSPGFNPELRYNYSGSKGFSLSTALSLWRTVSINRQRDHITENEIEEFPAFRKNKTSNWSPTLDIYMQQAWKNNRKLEVNLNGTYTLGSTLYLYSQESATVPYMTQNHTRQRSGGITGEIAYSQKVGTQDWDLSLKEEYTISNNRYTDTYLPAYYDKLRRSRTYLSTSFAGYILPKWSYTIGGGVSYNHTRNQEQKLTAWQPSAQFSTAYSFNPWLSLTLQANYSPKFPQFAQLTGVEKTVNPFLNQSGNPHLRTAHAWSLQLRPSIYKNNWNLTVGLYNSHINRQIGYLYAPTGDGDYMSYPMNYNHFNRFQASVSGGVYGICGVLDVNAMLYYNNYRTSDKNIHLNVNDFKYYLSVFATVGKWYIGAYYQSPSKSISGYNTMLRNSASYTVMASYRISHWKFGINISNPFNFKYSTKENYTTNMAHYNNISKSFSQSCSDIVQLSITYDLQFGRSYQTARRNIYNTIVDESVFKIL